MHEIEIRKNRQELLDITRISKPEQLGEIGTRVAAFPPAELLATYIIADIHREKEATSLLGEAIKSGNAITLRP